MDGQVPPTSPYQPASPLFPLLQQPEADLRPSRPRQWKKSHPHHAAPAAAAPASVVTPKAAPIRPSGSRGAGCPTHSQRPPSPSSPRISSALSRREGGECR
mmetsp:Transcript_19420/g.55685  ORF Transcript_19420/g.55685 Transcript_19420/m.55685 type:complete len:101 (+) Transcript_19420:573-875(+)